MVSADGCCSMRCRNLTVASCGVLLFLLGTAAVILGGVDIYYQQFLWYFGAGIWGGGCLVFAGVFGIFGGCRPHRGCQIGFILLSLFTLFTSAAIVVIRVFGLLFALKADGNTSAALSNIEKVEPIGNGTSIICNDPLDRSGLCVFYDYGPILTDQILIAVGGFAFIFVQVAVVIACCSVCQCCGAEWDDDNLYPVDPAVKAQPFLLPSYHQQSYMVTAPRSQKGEYTQYPY